MGRPKLTANAPPTAPAAATDNRDPQSPSERLTSLLEQFNGGSDYRAYIERTESNGERTYMGMLVLTENLFDDVRAKWGGGKFSGRIVDAKNQFAGRVPPFRIDGPAKLEDAPAVTAAPAVNAAPSRNEMLIVETLANIGRTLEQLAQRQQSSMDPTDQLVKLAGVLATVNPPRSAAGPGDATDTVGLIRELMALQREIAEDRPAPSSGGVFGAALEGAVKPLVGVLNRKMALEEAKLAARRPAANVDTLPGAYARGAPGMPAQNGAAAPANTTTSSSNGVAVSSDPLVNLIRSIPPRAWHFLLSCAVDDDDPADYVSVILNRLTEPAYEEIQKQLPRADFVAVLVREVPATAPYAAWFAGLTDALRASLELPGRGGLEAEGGPGEGTAAHPVESLDLERDL